MAYRFKLNESLARGVRRIALDQLDLAEQRLKDSSDPATSVHEVRKSLKRTRALLRLVRPGLGENVYRRENGELRDIARLLSAARDADVMRETVARIEARLSANRKACVGPVRELLNGSGSHGGSHAASKDLRKAKASIAAARKRLGRVKVKGDGFEPIVQGLEASYRFGRRALSRAERDMEGEALHELRKAVQHHWRQMLLLTRVWPEICRARAATARDIAQLLGEEHDYTVLMAFMGTHRNNGISSDDFDVVVEACRTRQAEIKTLALPMARRLFADRAKPFARRMEKYWQIARELSRPDGAPDAKDD